VNGKTAKVQSHTDAAVTVISLKKKRRYLKEHLQVKYHIEKNRYSTLYVDTYISNRFYIRIETDITFAFFSYHYP
jgi:uncharacterized protein YlbG (UPF0298 family)